MPKCPRCGGTSAQQIAPGYYQCTSNDSYGDRCTHRYQVGTDFHNNLCQCGTLAIGRCVDCGNWICGDHSSLAGNERICNKDARARTEARELREQEVLKATKRFVSKMAAVGNPGAQKLDASRNASGWLIACGNVYKDVVWFALLTDGTFRQVHSDSTNKAVFNGKWVSLQGEEHITPHAVGLWFPYGDIYIPGEDRPLELLDAVTRRLDAICVEHGLDPVSKK